MIVKFEPLSLDVKSEDLGPLSGRSGNSTDQKPDFKI